MVGGRLRGSNNKPSIRCAWVSTDKSEKKWKKNAKKTFLDFFNEILHR